ncbi:MAG: nucleotidyltransferase domain-containing protein [Peptococcaceae bacterium]|jgi:hypothetical protein|nr:nucleotidyltransferase domain-containing protein [Peptococcaceae bacterium]
MLQINQWMADFQKVILSAFPGRIIFLGLQGSYAREEATPTSDIDVVVIFDTLSMEDLAIYNQRISTMPHRDKVCGFLSGKAELLNWEKSDLFQFYHDTIAFYGNLDFLLPSIQKEQVQQAILIGACNLYHSCCHNILHEKSTDILKALYKQAIFTLQAKYYFDQGIYLRQKETLNHALSGADKKIMENYFSIRTADNLPSEQFLTYSETLFTWSSHLINQYHI